MSETGLLTQSQRAYLTDGSDYEGASKRMMDKRIRERLRQSLTDFRLLLEHYDDDEELAEVVDAAKNMDLDTDLGQDALANGLGFLLAAVSSTAPWRFNHDLDEGEGYEVPVKQAVTRASRYHGYALENVDVTIEFDARPLEEMTPEELARTPFRTQMDLLRSGEITDDELEEALRIKFDADHPDAPDDHPRPTVEDGTISIPTYRPAAGEE